MHGPDRQGVKVLTALAMAMANLLLSRAQLVRCPKRWSCGNTGCNLLEYYVFVNVECLGALKDVRVTGELAIRRMLICRTADGMMEEEDREVYESVVVVNRMDREIRVQQSNCDGGAQTPRSLSIAFRKQF